MRPQVAVLLCVPVPAASPLPLHPHVPSARMGDPGSKAFTHVLTIVAGCLARSWRHGVNLSQNLRIRAIEIHWFPNGLYVVHLGWPVHLDVIFFGVAEVTPDSDAVTHDPLDSARRVIADG